MSLLCLGFRVYKRDISPEQLHYHFVSQILLQSILAKFFSLRYKTIQWSLENQTEKYLESIFIL